MRKKSSEGRSEKKARPRIPLEHNGIQVNFCKNPACTNFGIPPRPATGTKGIDGKTEFDTYRKSGGSSSAPVLACKVCGEHPTLKSNQAISEELERMLKEVHPRKDPCCPDSNCTNHNIPVTTGRPYYRSYGRSEAGSRRYLCKACSKTFSIPKSTARQRVSHKNKQIFKLLVNKSPIRRLLTVAGIGAETFYNRLDFLYAQCCAFVANREQKLRDGKYIRRLYLSVDRQVYDLNWTSQFDKRNVSLQAVGTADNESGYVFATHLNFDSNMDPNAIEKDAELLGDHDLPHPYRRHARLWLKTDYRHALNSAAKSTRIQARSDALLAMIDETYESALRRNDIEVPPTLDNSTKLPNTGMQTHLEYTLYAHFLYLKEMLPGVEKLRFFLDQESGIRAACFSAFARDVLDRRVDAFFVTINSELTINEKRKARRKSLDAFNALKAENPTLTDNEIRIMLIKEQINKMEPHGKWADRWLIHPLAKMNEPEKAVCNLTDLGPSFPGHQYDIDHLANLYAKASLHGIDRYFMLLRRMVSVLERPPSTSSAGYRRWLGYSAYNPSTIVKLLTIFRVYYNYIKVSEEDRKTPAMRLGLAKAPVDFNDVIYY